MIRFCLALTAEAEYAFDDYKAKLRTVLGKNYVEGRTISFEKQRYRAKLQIFPGEPFAFTWRHRSASFDRVPDVYYEPPSDIPGWKIFILLYPGPPAGTY